MQLKLLNKPKIISLILGGVCALGNNPWALWYLSILSLILWFWLIIKNDKPKKSSQKRLNLGLGIFLFL